jgi:guanylate kinase
MDAIEVRPASITVLSGPSGSGKGTVIAKARQIAEEQDLKVWLSVSDTTRNPRPGEADGVEYNFISEEVFQQRVSSGYYLEHATFAGNSYGTPKTSVLNRVLNGVPVLIEIELQGARQIMAEVARGFKPRPVFVFLAPPSWEELVRGLGLLKMKQRSTSA